MTTRGVDYSFARPAPSALYAQGFRFVARYLSGGHSAKDLTQAELRILRAAGLSVVLVWEVGGAAAKGGFVQGVADAKAASAQVAALGLPAGGPIFFAVDYDAQGANLAIAVAYINGAASVLGVSRTGVYGGLRVIAGCLDAGACKYGWQTYAWSGGKWDARAQLRQVLNGQTVAGGTVDLCEAVADDYGQYPRPVAVVVPPKPKPTVVPPVPAPSTKGARVYTPAGVDFPDGGTIEPGDGPGRFIQEVQHYLHVPVNGIYNSETQRAVKVRKAKALGRYGFGPVIDARFYRALVGHA
jgi:hypothetical protein